MTIPASSIITSFVDLMLSGLVLTFLMMWYQFVPDLKVVTLPLFLLMAFAAALGIGLWISALMVRYRDFRSIVPFLVQFGCPCTSRLHERHRSGRVADVVCAQSDGWCHRRVSLVAPGRCNHVALAKLRCVVWHGRAATLVRHQVLPSYRTDIRRRYLATR